MTLVRVWTDVGSRKPVPLLAKVVEKKGSTFAIRYLSESDDKIWRYEDEMYEVDDDSIAEYLTVQHEEDMGFKVHEDGYLKVDSDDDYVPSDSESDTESESSEKEGDEPLDDEEEEEEEAEEENVTEW